MKIPRSRYGVASKRLKDPSLNFKSSEKSVLALTEITLIIGVSYFNGWILNTA
jgi:hypothetical protein